MAATPSSTANYYRVDISRISKVDFSNTNLTPEESNELIELWKGAKSTSLFVTNYRKNRVTTKQEPFIFFTAGQKDGSISSQSLSINIVKLQYSSEYHELTKSLPRGQNTFSLLIETDKDFRVTHIAICYCGKVFPIGLGGLEPYLATIADKSAPAGRDVALSSDLKYTTVVKRPELVDTLGSVLKVITEDQYEEVLVYHHKSLSSPITIAATGLCIVDQLTFDQFQKVPAENNSLHPYWTICRVKNSETVVSATFSTPNQTYDEDKQPLVTMLPAAMDIIDASRELNQTFIPKPKTVFESIFGNNNSAPPAAGLFATQAAIHLAAVKTKFIIDGKETDDLQKVFPQNGKLFTVPATVLFGNTPAPQRVNPIVEITKIIGGKRFSIAFCFEPINKNGAKNSYSLAAVFLDSNAIYDAKKEKEKEYDKFFWDIFLDNKILEQQQQSNELLNDLNLCLQLISDKLNDVYGYLDPDARKKLVPMQEELGYLTSTVLEKKTAPTTAAMRGSVLVSSETDMTSRFILPTSKGSSDKGKREARPAPKSVIDTKENYLCLHNEELDPVRMLFVLKRIAEWFSSIINDSRNYYQKGEPFFGKPAIYVHPENKYLQIKIRGILNLLDHLSRKLISELTYAEDFGNPLQALSSFYRDELMAAVPKFTGIRPRLNADDPVNKRMSQGAHLQQLMHQLLQAVSLNTREIIIPAGVTSTGDFNSYCNSNPLSEFAVYVYLSRDSGDLEVAFRDPVGLVIRTKISKAELADMEITLKHPLTIGQISSEIAKKLNEKYPLEFPLFWNHTLLLAIQQNANPNDKMDSQTRDALKKYITDLRATMSALSQLLNRLFYPQGADEPDGVYPNADPVHEDRAILREVEALSLSIKAIHDRLTENSLAASASSSSSSASSSQSTSASSAASSSSHRTPNPTSTAKEKATNVVTCIKKAQTQAQEIQEKAKNNHALKEAAAQLVSLAEQANSAEHGDNLSNMEGWVEWLNYLPTSENPALEDISIEEVISAINSIADYALPICDEIFELYRSIPTAQKETRIDIPSKPARSRSKPVRASDAASASSVLSSIDSPTKADLESAKQQSPVRTAPHAAAFTGSPKRSPQRADGSPSRDEDAADTTEENGGASPRSPSPKNSYDDIL